MQSLRSSQMVQINTQLILNRGKSPIFCAILVLILISVMSCSHVPPAGTDPSTVSKHQTDAMFTVPFITVRNTIDTSTAENYYGNRRATQSQGLCKLEWNKSYIASKVEKHIEFYIPEGSANLTDIDRFSSSDFWSTVGDTVGKEKPLLYVHGYKIDFEKACKRAQIMQHNLGLERRLILFSWPSDGASIKYARDEADITWSAKALREAIMTMAERFGPGGFDLAGHSLGGRGLVLALTEIAAAQKDDKPLLDQLIFFAPDVDAEFAAQRMPGIIPLARNVTLYASSNDHALQVSENLHGYPRLGQAGRHLDELHGLDIVDVSNLPVRRFTGHLYHIANKSVIHDVSELLNGRKAADEREKLEQHTEIGQQFWQFKE